jgi:hypothetical protein
MNNNELATQLLYLLHQVNQAEAVEETLLTTLTLDKIAFTVSCKPR